MSDVIDGVKVYPFHLPYPGTPALFHVACPEHSEFGFCGTESEARDERYRHLYHGHRSSHP